MLTVLNIAATGAVHRAAGAAGPGAAVRAGRGEARSRTSSTSCCRSLSKPFTVPVRKLTPQQGARPPCADRGTFFLLLIVYAVVTFEKISICASRRGMEDLQMKRLFLPSGSSCRPWPCWCSGATSRRWACSTSMLRRFGRRRSYRACQPRACACAGRPTTRPRWPTTRRCSRIAARRGRGPGSTWAIVLEHAGPLGRGPGGLSARHPHSAPKLDRAWYGQGAGADPSCSVSTRPVEALKRNTELQPMSPYGWYQLARIHVDRKRARRGGEDHSPPQGFRTEGGRPAGARDRLARRWHGPMSRAAGRLQPTAAAAAHRKRPGREVPARALAT